MYSPRASVVLHSSLYKKHQRNGRLQVCRLLWHAKAQRRNVVASSASEPTDALLPAPTVERRLLVRKLHRHNPRLPHERFFQELPKADNVVLRQQSRARRELLTISLQHNCKCTPARAIRSVTAWYSLCCHPYDPSEESFHPGRLCRRRRYICIRSHSDKQRNVSTHRKANAAADSARSCLSNVGEAPADAAGHATMSPDVDADNGSCYSSPHSARQTDYASANILSAEELLCVLRSMRDNSRNRITARSGGPSLCRKSCCLSPARRFSLGQKGASFARESSSLPHDNDICRPASFSSPSQPAAAPRPLSQSSDDACCFAASRDSGPMSSAFGDARDRWHTADFSLNKSAVSPQDTLSSLKTPSLRCSRPLLHSCLSRSLLYHLRRPSPGCFSALHLYAVSDLPVEPLLPELPHLVLKLLRLNFFSTTKEFVLCLHACTTLLRNSVRKGGKVMEVIASAKLSSEGNSPSDPAVPPNITGEAWLPVCLAFEATFCQRLQQQFEHTYEYLRRSDSSKTEHPNYHWPNETFCSTKGRKDGYGVPFTGMSEPKNTFEDKTFIPSVICAHSLQDGDSSSPYHAPQCSPLHGSVKSHRSNDDGIPISETHCPSMSPGLGRSAPVGAVLSPSCSDRVCPRGKPLEAAATGKSSVCSDARARETVSNCPSTNQVTETIVAAPANLKHGTPFFLQNDGKRLCQGHIPFPHVVLPQDLSMFISSYIILAKHSHQRVPQSLIAATACYLFLYSGYSSRQAFTLATSVVAKVASTLLAGNTATCAASPSGAASLVGKTSSHHIACALLSPYIGPFRADATSPGSSTTPCMLRAEQLNDATEISSTHTRLRYTSSSSRSSHISSSQKEEEGMHVDRQTPYAKQLRAQNCFSPLQLLAATLHHWIVEKADGLHPHDWTCVLQALRYLLRVKSASPPLFIPNVDSTVLEDDYYTECAGSSDTRPLNDTLCGESSITSDDSSPASSASSSEEASFSVRSDPGSSSSHLTDHYDASGQQPEHAQQPRMRSKAEHVDANLLHENTQFLVPRGELCYLRYHAQTTRVAALRAAEKTVAAAASAFSKLPSLMSPFSPIAAAVPSRFPSFRGTSQQVLDLPQRSKVLSNLQRHRHSYDRQACSGATVRAESTGLPVSSPFHFSSSLIATSAGGAAVIGDHCSDVNEANFEPGRRENVTHDDIQVCALAPPIGRPSSVEFLEAVRQILLLLQQRLYVAVTLTSLPVLTLSTVQLHDALLEKAHGFQAPAALWQREHDKSSTVGSEPRASTQERQVKQSVSISEESMSAHTCRENDKKTGVSHKRKCTEKIFNPPRGSAVSSISGMLAPVYELLCQRFESGLMSETLPAEWEDRFSGCSIFLSALVDALHLTVVENAHEKAADGATTAERLARSGVLDRKCRPSPSRNAGVASLLGSAQSSNALHDEVECTTKRLQSTLLRLFRLAISNVFLRRSSHSQLPTLGGRSEAVPVSSDMTYRNTERRSFASSDSFTVNAKGMTAQSPETITGCPSVPRLAWCPTPQDLVDLVKAACFLHSSFASLDGCGKRPKRGDKIRTGRNALSLTDEHSDDCVLSYPDTLNVVPREDCVTLLPESVSNEAHSIEKDEMHHLVLLLRACRDHVVNILKHQLDQPRKCKNKASGPLGGPLHHEEKPKTFLLPRDVSSLALHFHRCDLLSTVEFDTFGRYIMAAGQGGDGDRLPLSSSFSGQDFVCLLQIFVRPEIPDTDRISDVTYEKHVLPTEDGGQRDAWQSAFAVRLAVFMLDGMLPRYIKSFDDVSLAKVSLWLGTQFQQLQVYDRLNRYTARGRNRDSSGPISGNSRTSRSVLRAAAPVPFRHVSATRRMPCRLHLPAMRGMLERATRHVVQELLLRFCGVHVTSRHILSGDHANSSDLSFVGDSKDAHASEQSSVGDSKTTAAANRSSKCIPTTVFSAPLGPVSVVPKTSHPHVPCRQIPGRSGRVFTDAQAYVTLLLGLSKLPRDLVLLSDSQVDFAVEMDHAIKNRRYSLSSGKVESLSPQQCETARLHLEDISPPGMFLLRSLLSRKQLQLFFVPRVVLTDLQLKTFFSALHHLPLGISNGSTSKAAAAVDKDTTTESVFTFESSTLREHVLYTVFQASFLVDGSV